MAYTGQLCRAKMSETRYIPWFYISTIGMSAWYPWKRTGLRTWVYTMIPYNSSSRHRSRCESLLTIAQARELTTQAVLTKWFSFIAFLLSFSTRARQRLDAFSCSFVPALTGIQFSCDGRIVFSVPAFCLTGRQSLVRHSGSKHSVSLES